MTNKNDNSTGKEYSRPRRKWLTRLIIVTAVLGLFGGLFGWQYRVHIAWKYYEWRGLYPAIRTVPYSEMPEVDVPDDWIECSLGCLRFSLPPELATLEDTTRRKNDYAVFHSDFHSIAVHLDPVNGEVAPLLQLAHEFLGNYDGKLTTPRVYLEFCKFSTEDFCWSMSSQDVVRFMLFATVYQLSYVDWKTAETFFKDDVDRIISFYNGDSLVVVAWQSTTAPQHGGYIRVGFRAGSSVDVERDLLAMWARRICKSIRVVCTANMPTYPAAIAKPDMCCEGISHESSGN